MAKYMKHFPMALAVVGIILAHFLHLPAAPKLLFLLGTVAAVGALLSLSILICAAAIFSYVQANIKGGNKVLMGAVYRSVLASLSMAVVATIGFMITGDMEFYRYVIFALFFFAMGKVMDFYWLVCVVGSYTDGDNIQDVRFHWWKNCYD